MSWIFRHFVSDRLVYEERCAGYWDARYILFRMSDASSLIISATDTTEMFWSDDQGFHHRMTISPN